MTPTELRILKNQMVIMEAIRNLPGGDHWRLSTAQAETRNHIRGQLEPPATTPVKRPRGRPRKVPL